MPPGSSQKGTGKKGAGSIARQRSRNTTPSSLPPPPPAATLPPVEEADTEYLQVPAKLHLLRPITYDDFVDPTPTAAPIPDSKTLDAVITRLKQFSDLIEKRSLFNDLAMRAIVQARKQDPDQALNQPHPHGKGKRKPTEQLSRDDRSPLGKNPHGKHSKIGDGASSSSSLSPAGSPSTMQVDDKNKVEDDDDSSSDDGSGGPPRPAPPQNQTFGMDPSTFPDPTVYEIRDTNPGMSEDELKRIFSVAVYPKNDLADMIAGDPPATDYSNTKPTNQISFSTFSTYVEPYFRPFTEEDLAFLRERGNRVVPFNIPKLGKKHYKEIWADEDGAMNIDSTNGDGLPKNEGRGSLEGLDDEVAEQDKVSAPPLLARLLSAMRTESRPLPSEDQPMINGANSDPSASIGGDLDTAMMEPPVLGQDGKALPPAAFMSDSNTDAFRKGSHTRLEYATLDERLKMELQNVDFLGTADEDPDYDAQCDDEVSARLRLLQKKLRQVMLANGAKKARLTELVKERMAFQEYTTILEDLDTQVNSAYLKRTRTIGKSKKKRPGAAAAVQNTARPGIGDLTKTLMERRKRWMDSIGTVFDDENLTKVPRITDPGSSIFGEAVMMEWYHREKNRWDEEADED